MVIDAVRDDPAWHSTMLLHHLVCMVNVGGNACQELGCHHNEMASAYVDARRAGAMRTDVAYMWNASL
jgi:hypothetical protein